MEIYLNYLTENMDKEDDGTYKITKEVGSGGIVYTNIGDTNKYYLQSVEKEAGLRLWSWTGGVSAKDTFDSWQAKQNPEQIPDFYLTYGMGDDDDIPYNYWAKEMKMRTILRVQEEIATSRQYIREIESKAQGGGDSRISAATLVDRVYEPPSLQSKHFERNPSTAPSKLVKNDSDTNSSRNQDIIVMNSTLSSGAQQLIDNLDKSYFLANKFIDAIEGKEVGGKIYDFGVKKYDIIEAFYNIHKDNNDEITDSDEITDTPVNNIIEEPEDPKCPAKNIDINMLDCTRKNTLKIHPDKNPGCTDLANEKFNKFNNVKCKGNFRSSGGKRKTAKKRNRKKSKRNKRKRKKGSRKRRRKQSRKNN